MSSYSYENIKNELLIKNCQLLNTEEELNQIKQQCIKKKNHNFKIKYIASCGHNHEVFYNVFKNRGTGIICPSCKNKEIGNKKREKIIKGEMSPLKCIELEFNFIQLFKNIVEDNFDIIKAFDGCKVDLIFKPKSIMDDKWVGIQVKTTESINLTYSFHLNNNLYDNCLIILYCYQDKTLWLIPENIIPKQNKISIGYYKSKYNIYKVEIESISEKLFELYNCSNKFEFENLNTPKCVYQKREKEFRKFREENISFLNFIYTDMEGLCYDFKVNNYNIQEKVFSKDKLKDKYIFNICKKYFGKKMNKKNGQYDVGDNDFYWINCDDKIYFFVIPENILIEKGYVGDIYGTIHFKVNPKKFTEKTNWLQPYLFNYQTINEIENKNRLLKLLNFN